MLFNIGGYLLLAGSVAGICFYYFYRKILDYDTKEKNEELLIKTYADIFRIKKNKSEYFIKGIKIVDAYLVNKIKKLKISLKISYLLVLLGILSIILHFVF